MEERRIDEDLKDKTASLCAGDYGVLDEVQKLLRLARKSRFTRLGQPSLQALEHLVGVATIKEHAAATRLSDRHVARVHYPLTGVAWEMFCWLPSPHETRSHLARPVCGSAALGVLLRVENGKPGALVKLQVEIVSDGSREIFFDPARQLFHNYQPGFVEAFQQAWQQLCLEAEYARLKSFDARFWLSEKTLSASDEKSVDGNSAQVAFYAALRQAARIALGLSPETEIDDSTAITACFAQGNPTKLAGVAGYPEKLAAAWQKHLYYVLVCKADEKDVKTEHLPAAAKLLTQHERQYAPPQIIGVADRAELIHTLNGVYYSRESIRKDLYDERKDNITNLWTLTLGQVPLRGSYQFLPLLRRLPAEQLRRAPLLLDMPDTQPLRGASEIVNESVLRWEEEQLRAASDYGYKRHTLEEVWRDFQQVAGAPSNVVRKVVLAPPGAGKSTYVKMLAYACCAQLTEPLTIHGEPLRLVSHQTKRNLIPALIELKRWNETRSSFVEYLERKHPKTKAEEWERWITQGEVLFLLDGFDEIDPDRETFQKRMAEIKDCPVVVTCRTVSYEQYQGMFRSWPIFVLDGLTTAQWSDHIRLLAGADGTENFDAQALIDSLQRNAGMQIIAASPLLLDVICFVVSKTQNAAAIELPATRTELYRKAVYKMLSHRGNVVDYDQPFHIEEKVAVLARVAFEMFAQTSGTGRRLSLPYNELMTVLLDALAAEGRPRDSLLAAQFIEELNRLRILNASGSEHNENARHLFYHLSFHEYLTAVHLARCINGKTRQKEERGWKAKVRAEGKTVSVLYLLDKKAWAPEWREVFLYLTGELDDPLKLLNLITDGEQKWLWQSKDDYFRHRLILTARCLPELSELVKQEKGAVKKRDKVANEVIGLWQTWAMEEYSLSNLLYASRALMRTDAKVFAQKKSQILFRDYYYSDLLKNILIRVTLKKGLKGAMSAFRHILFTDNEIKKAMNSDQVKSYLAELFPAKIKTGDKLTRGRMALFLSVIGEYATTGETLEAIAQMLYDEDQDLRKIAALALIFMGEAAAQPNVIQGLAKLLLDGDTDAKILTTYTLEEIGTMIPLEGMDTSLEILTALLTATRKEKRVIWFRCASAGGHIAIDIAIKLIAKALDERRPQNKRETAILIQIIRCFARIMVIAQILKVLDSILREEDKRLKKMTVKAVRRIGAKAATIGILDALVQMLHSEQWDAAKEVTDVADFPDGDLCKVINLYFTKSMPSLPHTVCARVRLFRQGLFSWKFEAHAISDLSRL